MNQGSNNSSNVLRVTFRLAGPIKRSTFQRQPPDPIEEALGDVLHWSWSTRLQATRLKRDVSEELTAWGTRRRSQARRAFSATSCDEHLLLVCAANLHRALDRVPKAWRHQLSIPKQSRRGLWLLRNIYEHWDEIRRHFRTGTNDPKGTIQKLRKEFPAADPWSFTIHHESGEVVLADVVAMRTLVRELRELEARVLRLERSWRLAQAKRTPAATTGG